MPLTPEEMRALFPITRRYAYLDHAAIAPLSTPVRSTMEVFLTRQSEEPFEREHWERLRGQVRNRVAELVATRPESIAFIKNTTTGLGLVAAGLDWESGDNVVGVDREFPANIYPWMDLRRKGVELRLYRPSNGRIEVAAIARLCDQRTRVLAVSAVQFWNGFRVDLSGLRKALRGKEVLLIVDAIQAVGALRIDLSELSVDLLCSGAQKWPLGPVRAGPASVPASSPSAARGWCRSNCMAGYATRASSSRCVATSCAPHPITTTATPISIACSRRCPSDLLAKSQTRAGPRDAAGGHRRPVDHSGAGDPRHAGGGAGGRLAHEQPGHCRSGQRLGRRAERESGAAADPENPIGGVAADWRVFLSNRAADRHWRDPVWCPRADRSRGVGPPPALGGIP